VNAPVERKVKAGAYAGAAVGLVTWALVTWIPAWRGGIPGPVAAVLPFALAWAGHVIAAWAAPHTPRPTPPVTGIYP
jgi:hypothetical protein